MLNKSEFFNRRRCEHCSLCGRCRVENTRETWRCRDENTLPILRDQVFIQGSVLCGDSDPNIDCIYIKNSGLVAIEIKDRKIEYVDKDDKERLKSQLLSVCSASDREGLTIKAFVLLVSSVKNSKHSDLQLLEICEGMLLSVGIKLDKNNIMRDGRHLRHKYTKFKVVRCKDLTEECISSLL